MAYQLDWINWFLRLILHVQRQLVNQG